jgi:hypothetical protein
MRSAPAVADTNGAQQGPTRLGAPEDSVLHRVLRNHLETFLAQARARNDGDGLPMFIEREFREFLSCGVLPLADRPAAARLV